ncbi:CYTH domain-containing protein [Tumebacillus sp. ITR2]|uniref:CYTH domain-containing protein n=1 Tax=Tumebacillus amylolyticus TaxID=2801339 RepID=A0ABS1J8U7_9BACL|nr:CYTH domain-containing protein [Tumebacillus amylolyticus]MBL0386600.1 CYTH domain-containing protein [Tumebacillus amylolyticus]
MAIEMEVKFRMDADTWAKIKSDYDRERDLHHIERQSNQYYDTSDRRLGAKEIGLRLRVLEDRSILAVKRSTDEAHKRIEIEETYEDAPESLPPHSPALQELMTEVGIQYDDIAPLVMLRTERFIYEIEEQGVKAEVCFDDVSIVGTCREYKLYEIEFELVDGSEERLYQIVSSFKNQYGATVEESSIPKLVYALNLVNCD